MRSQKRDHGVTHTTHKNGRCRGEDLKGIERGQSVLSEKRGRERIAASREKRILRDGRRGAFSKLKKGRKSRKDPKRYPSSGVYEGKTTISEGTGDAVTERGKKKEQRVKSFNPRFSG